MPLMDLQSLKTVAAGAADHPNTSLETAAKYDRAKEIARELSDGNYVDYLSRYYREWYRDWQNGERDAPCECSNPACPLKNGRLPYEIRRAESPFSSVETPDPETRIRNYLDDHPGARVLDEAVDDLEQKKHEAEDLFQEVVRIHQKGLERDDDDDRNNGRKGRR